MNNKTEHIYTKKLCQLLWVQKMTTSYCNSYQVCSIYLSNVIVRNYKFLPSYIASHHSVNLLFYTPCKCWIKKEKQCNSTNLTISWVCYQVPQIGHCSKTPSKRWIHRSTALWSRSYITKPLESNFLIWASSKTIYIKIKIFNIEKNLSGKKFRRIYNLTNLRKN